MWEAWGEEPRALWERRSLLTVGHGRGAEFPLLGCVSCVWGPIGTPLRSHSRYWGSWIKDLRPLSPLTWARRDAGMPSRRSLQVERDGRLWLPSTFLPSLWLFLSVIHLIAILYRLLASALFYLILSLPALYIQSIVGACAGSVPSISLLPPHPEGVGMAFA